MKRTTSPAAHNGDDAVRMCRRGILKSGLAVGAALLASPVIGHAVAQPATPSRPATPLQPGTSTTGATQPGTPDSDEVTGMTYKHLGRTGLQVSSLVLGTLNFGELTDERAAFQIMDKALEAGINFFDTANVYGGPQAPNMKKGFGTSEEIIGRWLAQGDRRDRIVLASKVYQPMGLGPNDRRLSAYHIRRACEASLRRLRTDHIDLYQMHHVDRRTPWDEIWEAMEQLVREGKTTYIGSSNFAGWDIATAQGVAASRHFLGLVSEQSLYNLAVRTIELEVIPALRYHGVGLITWSPLSKGILGGAFGNPTAGRRATPQVKQRIEKLRPQLEKYEALCRNVGEEPAIVALAWLLRNPAVTAPILGPRTVEQLTGSLRALKVTLSDETLRQLDEIWPGPGGEAPQAYAW